MTKRVVLVFGDSGLLIEVRSRQKDGTVKTGYVVNGDWNYERRGDYVLARDNNGRIANKWLYTPTDREVSVPPNIKGHYNDIINWAMGTI